MVRRKREPGIWDVAKAIGALLLGLLLAAALIVAMPRLVGGAEPGPPGYRLYQPSEPKHAPVWVPDDTPPFRLWASIEAFLDAPKTAVKYSTPNLIPVGVVIARAPGGQPLGGKIYAPVPLPGATGPYRVGEYYGFYTRADFDRYAWTDRAPEFMGLHTLCIKRARDTEAVCMMRGDANHTVLHWR